MLFRSRVTPPGRRRTASARDARQLQCQTTTTAARAHVLSSPPSAAVPGVLPSYNGAPPAASARLVEALVSSGSRLCRPALAEQRPGDPTRMSVLHPPGAARACSPPVVAARGSSSPTSLHRSTPRADARAHLAGAATMALLAARLTTRAARGGTASARHSPTAHLLHFGKRRVIVPIGKLSVHSPSPAEGGECHHGTRARPCERGRVFLPRFVAGGWGRSGREHGHGPGETA